MTCTECNDATDDRTRLYFYRIGNKEIGWANIALLGCRDHVKLALDKLNKDE